MTTLCMCKKVVCFDLDDTLYKEIDFLKSAYHEIAISVGHIELFPQMLQWYKAGDNVFLKLNQYIKKATPISEYLEIYRNHSPAISLSDGVEEVLNELDYRGIILGLITDGRSISQRNKIRVLGLERWFEHSNIIISEEIGSDKTNEKNFRHFEEHYPGGSFTYVGDNPQKDFVVPNYIGWQTIMLKDDGRNIHQQSVVPKEYLPRVVIRDLSELLDFIK